MALSLVVLINLPFTEEVEGLPCNNNNTLHRRLLLSLQHRLETPATQIRSLRRLAVTVALLVELVVMLLPSEQLHS